MGKKTARGIQKTLIGKDKPKNNKACLKSARNLGKVIRG